MVIPAFRRDCQVQGRYYLDLRHLYHTSSVVGISSEFTKYAGRDCIQTKQVLFFPICAKCAVRWGHPSACRRRFRMHRMVPRVTENMRRAKESLFIDVPVPAAIIVFLAR